ncbi:MAG: hypothetical protein ACI4XB_03395 [Ruminococcus sp.]
MKRNQDSQFARRIQEEYRRDMARCHMLEQQMNEELEKTEPDFDRVDALAREIALLRGLMQEPEHTKQEQKALLPLLFRKKRFLRIEWLGMIAAVIFVGIGLSIYPTIQQGRGALEVVEPTQSVQTTVTSVSDTTGAAEIVPGYSTETYTTAVTEAPGETGSISSGSTDVLPAENVPEQSGVAADTVQGTTSAVSSKETVTIPAAGTVTSTGKTTHTTHTTQTSRTTASTSAAAATGVPDEETTTLPETTTTVTPGTTLTTTTFFTTQTTVTTTTFFTTQTTVTTTTFFTTQTTMRTTAQTTYPTDTEATEIQTTTMQTTLTEAATTTVAETSPVEPEQTAYLILHSYPDKVEYQPGEELDFTGATISAGYWYTDNNGVKHYQPEVNTQDLTSESVHALIQSGALTVDTSQLDMNTPGTYYVVLRYTYGDTTARARFSIFVNNPAAESESTAASETSTVTTAMISDTNSLSNY